MGIEIAILTLIVCAILLLVAIFAVLMIKNKKKSNDNVVDVVEKLNDIQREQIVADMSTKYNETNTRMLEENTRNNSFLNTSLTTTINTNNQNINDTINNFREEQTKKFDTLKEKLEERLRTIENEIKQQFFNIKEDNNKNNSYIKDMLINKFTEINKDIASELDKLRTENQAKLDEMRGIVDEKMQKTLNERITESFKVINEQLLAVHKGLNEMSNLTNGVNNLNKIMGNVKTRGMWGEVSLNTLLEQILTKEQYKEQLQIRGKNAVDFAVVLPGKMDNENIYLPIDAKFPLVDYENLVEASESCDKERIDIARKDLLKRVKDEAKSISEKYINVPKTTNFAIMYFPIEGLFAEVIKESGLIDELQNKYKVVVCGPTTISALLNSLQLGFKTLQIQKNSREVWKALSKFKTEFQRFSKSLESAEKQVNTVAKTIEETNKKTKTIEKTLNKLDMIDYDPAELDLIGGTNADSDD